MQLSYAETKLVKVCITDMTRAALANLKLGKLAAVAFAQSMSLQIPCNASHGSM